MDTIKLKLIAVVNTSSFCGKVIEDDVIPITSGCYKESVSVILSSLSYILEIIQYIIIFI